MHQLIIKRSRACVSWSGLGSRETSRQVARREFLEHIENIARQPDTLLVTIYAPDSVVIWSSNPALIGTKVVEDDQFNESFATKSRVFATYHDVVSECEEQKFPRPPKGFFIENYIPMLNARTMLSR